MTRTGPPRRPLALAAAAVAAFLIGLAVWLPAALALRALPAPYACADIGGTLWRGRCADLRYGDARLGSAVWTLRPLPLLTGRIDADLAWSAVDSRVSARIDARIGSAIAPGFAAGSGALALRDVRGSVDVATLRALPLWPPSIVTAWPPGEGRLRLDLETIEFDRRGLSRILGTVDADGLVSVGRERWVLGDYRLAWRDGTSGERSRPVGELTDRGGPLELRATIRPVGTSPDGPPGGAWGLTGSVRARDASWRPRLMAFGPADAEGRHTLSVEWR